MRSCYCFDFRGSVVKNICGFKSHHIFHMYCFYPRKIGKPKKLDNKSIFLQCSFWMSDCTRKNGEEKFDDKKAQAVEVGSCQRIFDLNYQLWLARLGRMHNFSSMSSQMRFWCIKEWDEKWHLSIQYDVFFSSSGTNFFTLNLTWLLLKDVSFIYTGFHFTVFEN